MGYLKLRARVSDFFPEAMVVVHLRFQGCTPVNKKQSPPKAAVEQMGG